MEGNNENVLRSTTGVKVNYDTKKSDRMTFILPNEQMATLGLVPMQQQIEINKSIRSYTNGKNCIEWSMVGIRNALDIIRAVKKFKEKKNTYFYKMDITKYIWDTESFENRIVFYLDGKQMHNLNSDWECELARDFEKNHVFHAFESVIINRRIENQNSNKHQFNNDINTDKIESILGAWDVEVNNIIDELQDREMETFKALFETVGCLTEMNDTNNELDLLFNKYHSFDIKSYLEQIKRNQETEKLVEQEIQIVENKLKLVNDKVIKQYLKIKDNERMNETKMKEFQKDIAQKKIFLQDNNVCENTFVKKEKEKEKVEDETTNHIKTKETQYQSQIVEKDNDSNNGPLFLFNNLISNLECNILKHFVSNIIAYGLHCSSGSFNGNTNFCMNNNSSIATSMKRSTVGEHNRLVDVQQLF